MIKHIHKILFYTTVSPPKQINIFRKYKLTVTGKGNLMKKLINGRIDTLPSHSLQVLENIVTDNKHFR